MPTRWCSLDGFRDAVKELTEGKGVDIVLDVVGGDVFTDSLRSLSTQGRLLVVGFAAGQGIPEVKVNRLLLNNIDVRGVGWGAFAMMRPGYMQEQWQALLPMIESGAVKPPIGAVYELEEFGQALVDMDERGRWASPSSESVTDPHGQAAYAVRFDWGPTGAAAVAEGADLAVVVDVLSFTTTLTVAVERGMKVFPYRWKRLHRRGVRRRARRRLGGRPLRGVGRSACRRQRPGALAARSEADGAALAERLLDLLRPRRLGTHGGGCLSAQPHRRGRVARGQAGAVGPASPSSRPASAGPTARCGPRSRTCGVRVRCSPHWWSWASRPQPGGRASGRGVPRRRTRTPLRTDELLACASGGELVAAGFGDDVLMAAELDVSDVVPVLAGEAFVAAG